MRFILALGVGLSRHSFEEFIEGRVMIVRYKVLGDCILTPDCSQCSRFLQCDHETARPICSYSCRLCRRSRLPRHMQAYPDFHGSSTSHRISRRLHPVRPLVCCYPNQTHIDDQTHASQSCERPHTQSGVPH